jgi:hypothetical protein
MHRTVRIPVAAGAVVLGLALPAAVTAVGVVGAAPAAVVATVTPSTFVPPPGCTGDWNTTQSATFNHAPGTAPGCAVAESHV